MAEHNEFFGIDLFDKDVPDELAELCGFFKDKKFQPKRLVMARDWNGFSVKKLACIIGISKQELRRYEKDVAIPNLFIVVRIADALQFPLSFFYTELQDVEVSCTFF